MIEPQDQTSREYAELLASHLVSGNQSAYRALKLWGDGVYRRANADLVAWAEDRAAYARWAAEANAAVDAEGDEGDEPEPEVVAPKRTRRSRRKES